MVQNEIRNYDLIVFDLDGTLIDSKADIAASVNFTLALLKLEPLPVEMVASFIGKGVKNLLTQSLGEHAKDKFSAAIKVFRQHYSEHCLDHTVLYPRVKETLEHLNGLKRAIVTNKPGMFTSPILKGLEIESYFDFVLGGDEVPRKKPSPDPIYMLLERFQVMPSKVLMVGDSPLDIQMGKAAKIQTCAVVYGYGSETDLISEKPDFLVKDIFDLTGKMGLPA